jgi:hypothetical protein
MQKDDFSLRNYKRCLEDSLSLGYNFLTLNDYFCNQTDSEKNIILRHDIDTQLDIAVEMSNIENILNIRSTYFVRLHSHAYNFLCLKDLRKIKKIINNNHEIGLHYESDFYVLNNKDINKSIQIESNIIEYFCNIKVKTICPHEPTRTNCFNLENINYNQAYDEKLFKKYKYISDSSCRWRDGSFYENIHEGHKNLYILTHPYWWYNNSPIENY